MFHPLISCICHVIDFHEHSTRWLGFEYDSFKATFPQRLPEFCQSPMALLTYSDDPWLPGWTRLLGQALPSPPNPAWVLPVLSMTAPENCLPPWSGAGDHHIVISLSFHSTFTSCQDFLSTFEIELVCHPIEEEREIPSQNSRRHLLEWLFLRLWVNRNRMILSHDVFLCVQKAIRSQMCSKNYEKLAHLTLGQTVSDVDSSQTF